MDLSILARESRPARGHVRGGQDLVRRAAPVFRARSEASPVGNGITLSSDSDTDGYLDSNTPKTGSAAIAPVRLRTVRNGDSVAGSYSANRTTRRDRFG
ncbi:hypothetical protein [Streptomyces griseorubiginosus]|uniref:hypothetical protein n=1 Tax=Streptomyces griseorubiginosus TaxID=67304 RepID=UPI0036EB18D0